MAKQIRAGTMRHRVDVMEPTLAEGTRGQTQGNPKTIYKDHPAYVSTLSGRELIQARTVFAEATYQVEMYADPAIPVKPDHYLVFQGKKLAIAFANDEQQAGYYYTLLCGERVNA